MLIKFIIYTEDFEMNFFDKNHIITEIVAAIDVHGTKNGSIHTDRPSHGLALFYNKGSIYNFSDGKTMETEAGECIYLPKGSTYAVRSCPESPTETACYAVNFKVLDDEIYEPMKLKIKNPAALAIYRDIIKHRLSHSSTAHEEALSDLYKLISIIKKEYFAPYSPSIEKSIIEPAVNYIHSHAFGEEISAERLAYVCDISQSYMRKLFDRVYGISPIEYLRSVRLEYAKELLLSGEYSVTEVSIRAGFNDTAYFSREFKKYFSYPPSKCKIQS